jgi:hypothetical protein
MSKDIHAKRHSQQSVGQGQRVMETQRVGGFLAFGHFLNFYFSQGTNPPLIHRLVAACRSGSAASVGSDPACVGGRNRRLYGGDGSGDRDLGAPVNDAAAPKSARPRAMAKPMPLGESLTMAVLPERNRSS